MASCAKLRLLSGSSCTCLESIRFWSAGVGCTSCCAAVTSTTSARPPTVSLPFNSTRSLTCSEMPFTVDVWKPAERERHLVVPDGQQLQAVEPGRGRHRLERPAGAQIRRHDGDARHDGARLVGDGPDEGGGGLLREGRCRPGEDEHHEEQAGFLHSVGSLVQPPRARHDDRGGTGRTGGHRRPIYSNSRNVSSRGRAPPACERSRLARVRGKMAPDLGGPPMRLTVAVRFACAALLLFTSPAAAQSPRRPLALRRSFEGARRLGPAGVARRQVGRVRRRHAGRREGQARLGPLDGDLGRQGACASHLVSRDERADAALEPGRPLPRLLERARRRGREEEGRAGLAARPAGRRGAEADRHQGRRVRLCLVARRQAPLPRRDDFDPTSDPEKMEGWKRKTAPPIVVDRYHFKSDQGGYLRRLYSHLTLFEVDSKKAERADARRVRRPVAVVVARRHVDRLRQQPHAPTPTATTTRTCT